MLNSITIGQYYPVDSPVHRLDPRIKLILTIGFIVSVFLAQSFCQLTARNAVCQHAIKESGIEIVASPNGTNSIHLVDGILLLQPVVGKQLDRC